MPLSCLLSYHCFCLCGGLRNTADPPDLGLVIAGHIGLTVSAAVEDVKRLRLLCWQRLTQLRHHIGDDGTDTLFIAAIAIQWTHEDGNIPIMGRDEPYHPLFEIGSVISRIAVGNGYGDRNFFTRRFLWFSALFALFTVLFPRFPLRKILSIDRKGGRIDMQFLRFYAEALTRLQCQSCKERCWVMLVDPIQGSPQRIVIEHVGCDSLSQ